MSIQLCCFGVPSHRRVSEVLGTVRDALAVHCREVPDLWMRVVPDEDLNGSTLRYFTIGTLDGAFGWVDRGRVHRHLVEQGWEVVTLLHDDQHGIYWFHRVAMVDGEREVFHLMSDTSALGGDVHQLECDYGQKGFDDDELDVLNAKDFDELTTREIRAVTDWENAVIIGLRQYYPAAASYLAVLRLDHEWQVLRDGVAIEPIRRANDYSWTPCLDPFPRLDDWQRAGLVPRYY